ncbi:MAG: acetylglutamate kinase [Spirochaetaceae bacterium]
MKPTIVIKLGGRAFENPEGSKMFARELAGIRKTYSPIVVHGGGKEITDLSRRLGVEPQFVEGLRITTAEEMNLVDMVLAGLVNKRLVRVFRQVGVSAVGVSGADGSLVSALPLGPGTKHTGMVGTVDPKLIQTLLTGGFLPVVAPPSADISGTPFNINADSVALGLAEGLRAEDLVYLSDVPGVRIGEEVLRHISVESIEEEIARGSISGGMIPKLRSCAAALRGGVKNSIIGQYSREGDLLRLLSQELGTRIGSS